MARASVPGFGEGIPFYEGPTSQGNGGNWAACGPFASGVACHAVKRDTFNEGELNLIVNRMRASGHFSNNGSTLDDVFYDESHNEGVSCRILADYNGTPLDQYIPRLEACLDRGNVAVVYVTNGGGIQQNQSGVGGHFVAAGGRDTSTGEMFIMNGDKVPDNIPNSPYWASLASMQAANIRGIIEITVPWWSGVNGPSTASSAPPVAVDAKPATPTPVAVPAPVSATSGVPAGWHDDGKVLTASNGKTITGGIRDRVLASGWSKDDLPENDSSALYKASPLLFQDGRWGDGVIQFFYRSAIAVASKPEPALTGGKQEENVVITLPSGSELFLAREARDTVEGQLKQAQDALAVAQAATKSATASSNITDAVSLIDQALADIKKEYHS